MAYLGINCNTLLPKSHELFPSHIQFYMRTASAIEVEECHLFAIIMPQTVRDIHALYRTGLQSGGQWASVRSGSMSIGSIQPGLSFATELTMMETGWASISVSS